MCIAETIETLWCLWHTDRARDKLNHGLSSALREQEVLDAHLLGAMATAGRWEEINKALAIIEEAEYE